MPVLSQTPVITYTANGSVTSFAYPYQILKSEDLKVYVDGTIVTTGYSVTGVGNAGGGDVIFLAAPANGLAVRLARFTTVNRITDYVEGGAVPAATLDADFDRTIMMLQEYSALALREDTSGVIDAVGRKIVNLGTATNPNDATSKSYVDTLLASQVIAAAGSASAASASATTAGNWATAANISAASASTYANNASTSAGNASTSATNASNSAAAAAVSAANASHPWVVSGSDTYYTAGNVGIGATPTAGATLDVYKASGPTSIRARCDSVITDITSEGTTSWISTTGSTSLHFWHAGAVRFSIGSAGQWGVGGVDYGTAGHVLTSGGPSSAPTWTGVLGADQTWQDMTGSRAFGTTYTNSSGKPIMVVVTGQGNNAGVQSTFLAFAGGIHIATASTSEAQSVWNAFYNTLTLIVPNGQSYVFTSNSTALIRWVELR